MKNTTRIIAMLLFISISAFSQEKIQWSGAVSNDMSNNLNWLKMDGSSPISPIGKKLSIKNESIFNVEISTNPIVGNILQILINLGVITELEIENGFIVGTTPVLNDPELSSELSVNSILVNNDNGLLIKTNGKLTVETYITNQKKIIIKSSSTGTGSLIVKGDITNAVETSTNYFEIERWFDINADSNSKWHLISSPTTLEESITFQGHYLNSYNEGLGDFKAISSTSEHLVVGEGYIARLDFTDTDGDGVTDKPNPIVFNRYKPNTGLKSANLKTGDGNTYFNLPTNFNLVGNPYTSNINWDRMWNDLQEGQNKSLVDATMYYYIDDDLGVGEGTAGEGSNGWKIYNANTTFGDGDGFISMGQAFGVLLTDNSSNATGTLYFRTEFQTHEGGNAFHKKSKSFGNYFELNTSSNNLTDKIYFKFNESTSDAYDANLDAYKFNSFGETPTPYFVSSDNKRLAICEMPKAESVDLGFVMDTDGEVTFSLSNVQDFDEIILEDKSNNTFTELTKNTYSFQHSTDDAETGRFTLHFKKETLSEVEETIGMKVYSSNSNIFIQSNRTLTNAIVNLYNTNGQLILSEKYSSLINEQINTNISSGVYLIEVSSNENRFTTRINIKH